MNFQDQERERAKRRAAPDDDTGAAELTRLWFRYLREQDVEVEHLSADDADRNLRYWRAIDAKRGDD